MSDDDNGNPDEERKRLLSRQRMLGVQGRMQYGLGDSSFEDELNGVFDEALLDEYDKCLNVDWNETDADLGRRFGVFRGTVGRWRKGTGMSLKEFLTVAASNNAEFPMGSIAALEAYCKSFKYVQEKIGRGTADIEPDQALCLFHTIRSVEWHKGCGGDAALLHEAAQTIRDYVSDLFPRSVITGVAGIRATVTVRIVEWLILESVMKHENWF